MLSDALEVLGLSLVTAAAFMVAIPAGLLVAGACLVLVGLSLDGWGRS